MAIPGLQQSANDIIASALRKIHVLAPGEPMDAADAADGLVVLNQMIGGWNRDVQMVYTINITDFQLVAGKQVYKLGTGGDFNIQRPAQIERMSFMLMTNPNNPAEFSMQYTQSEQEWQKIVLKLIQTTYPSLCYDDGSFPFRNLSMYPVPLDSLNKIRIYSWAPLTYFADLKTSYSFPEYYPEVISYQLALRLNGEWEGTMSPDDKALAQQLLGKLKSANSEPAKLECDGAVVGNGGLSGQQWRQQEFGIP